MSQRLSHMVYFELDNPTPERIETQISECQKYLNDHPGLEFFAVGTLNPDLSREVNDKGFHVSLHTVFADRAAHDQYQVSERHVAFIEGNKANWKRVRVFDSDLLAD